MSATWIVHLAPQQGARVPTVEAYPSRNGGARERLTAAGVVAMLELAAANAASDPPSRPVVHVEEQRVSIACSPSVAADVLEAVRRIIDRPENTWRLE